MAPVSLDRWCPLEYKIEMQTVVETPTFSAAAKGLLSEKEIADIIDTVAADPQVGEVMEGTGGFRKFRVARPGMGKRGGVRVVYIYKNDKFPVFLITVFPKNKMANLSKAQRNELKKRADKIFTDYRR
ncbi:MAG TPA: type II toxin-antitoxin system RelE/ParE family toxin [Terriglobia bacterium]|nr:type II toxin-antitoxin system RelE/ParE family toxin [Terriglobia bacterium]